MSGIETPSKTKTPSKKIVLSQKKQEKIAAQKVELTKKRLEMKEVRTISLIQVVVGDRLIGAH